MSSAFMEARAMEEQASGLGVGRTGVPEHAPRTAQQAAPTHFWAKRARMSLRSGAGISSGFQRESCLRSMVASTGPGVGGRPWRGGGGFFWASKGDFWLEGWGGGRGGGGGGG